jgi:hypothetical protein
MHLGMTNKISSLTMANAEHNPVKAGGLHSNVAVSVYNSLLTISNIMQYSPRCLKLFHHTSNLAMNSNQYSYYYYVPYQAV